MTKQTAGCLHRRRHDEQPVGKAPRGALNRRAGFMLAFVLQSALAQVPQIERRGSRT